MTPIRLCPDCGARLRQVPYVQYEPVEAGTFVSVREEDEFWHALCACGYESDGYLMPLPPGPTPLMWRTEDADGAAVALVFRLPAPTKALDALSQLAAGLLGAHDRDLVADTGLRRADIARALNVQADELLVIVRANH